MYPVIDTLETSGFYKQNARTPAGHFYEMDPCVLREERPSYIACSNCEKFMSKLEVDYETYRKASYEWLEAKLTEVQDLHTDILKNLKKVNKQIRDENKYKTEDKQKPEWTPETLKERLDNQIDEAKTHGRQSWLKHTLKDIINQGKGHGIKCFECRT